MSIETGIAPNDLLNAPDGVFEAMVDVMRRRAVESRKRSR